MNFFSSIQEKTVISRLLIKHLFLGFRKALPVFVEYFILTSRDVKKVAIYLHFVILYGKKVVVKIRFNSQISLLKQFSLFFLACTYRGLFFLIARCYSKIIYQNTFIGPARPLILQHQLQVLRRNNRHNSNPIDVTTVTE